jgi:hypothetical protein
MIFLNSMLTIGAHETVTFHCLQHFGVVVIEQLLK